jgi:CheY-like chemotaxis protein
VRGNPVIARHVASLLGTEPDPTNGSAGLQAKSEGSPATVLVVVYDTWLRWQLSDALGTAGYEVVRASNGPSGLRLAHRHRLDLILLAPRLPELSGVPLTDAFRELPRTRHIPIVFVERTPLAGHRSHPSLVLEDRWIITHSLSHQSKAMPCVDAPVRGKQSTCARRSRRTPTVYQEVCLQSGWCMPSRHDAAYALPEAVPRA